MRSSVTRPAIPVLAWWCASLWTGIVCAEAFAWHLWSTGAGRCVLLGWAGLAGALGTGAATAVGARRRWRSAVVVGMLLACGATLGLGLGGLRWASLYDVRARMDGATSVHGTVMRDPVAGARGSQVLVRVDGSSHAVVRVMVGPESEPPPASRRVSVSGVVRSVDPADEWTRRSHRRAEVASVRATAVRDAGWARGLTGHAAPVRERVRALCARVEGSGGDVLQGVLIGDRSRVRGSAAEDDLRICGLSHLLAVSGTHLGILALGAGRLAAMARGGLVARVLAVALVGMAYVVVSGVQTSATRALVMGCVAGAAQATGRRGDGLAALSVAASAMLLSDPVVAFDIGFQLSVSAVGGLILFASLAARWAEAAMGRRARLAASALAVTLVAQVATAPVAVPTFGIFSLVAPVANAVALPLLTVGLAIGVVGGLVGSVVAPVGEGVLRLAALPLSGVTGAAGAFARIPGAAVGLDADASALGALLACVMALVWWRWPQPRDRRSARWVAVAAALLGTLLMAGVWWLPGNVAELVVLDVGQGDAILVRDGKSHVLIDTGPDPGVLRTAITRHGVRRIDAVVLTHDHADHTAGLAGLVGLARVDMVVVPAVAEEDAFTACETAVERLSPRDGVRTTVGGDVFRVGSTTLTVLWPPGPEPSLRTNDTSIIMLLERGGFRAVLTGDAEEVALSRLGAAGSLERVDVLKVPHHGSANGLTEGALEAWAPTFALVSVGEGNDHGHPSATVIEMLDRHGVRTLRTDLSGDITVRIGDHGYSVTGARSVSDPPPYATIGAAAGRIASLGRATARRPARRPEAHVRDTFRPQARLPHPRLGGPALGAGRRTAEEAAGRGSRPRLQPVYVRRGHGGRRRDRRCREHAAVHVRAPPRHRAQGRSHVHRRPQHTR